MPQWYYEETKKTQIKKHLHPKHMLQHFGMHMLLVVDFCTSISSFQAFEHVEENRCKILELNLVIYS